jgi:hypothetical protein
MSTRILALKEKLANVNSMLDKSNINEEKTVGLRLRLSKVVNIISENESKIWLRTRVGEPMLKTIQESVDNAFRVLENGNSATELFEVALREVERNAANIDEESRRRSMVVT